MKSSNIYETDHDQFVDYEYWSSNHNAHETLSISNFLHSKCMDLFFLPENTKSVFQMVIQILVY
jgi:hypothetical protein